MIAKSAYSPVASFNTTVQTQVRIFDDYVRFHNPGHLPEGITLETILKEHYSYHRNPIIVTRRSPRSSTGPGSSNTMDPGSSG